MKEQKAKFLLGSLSLFAGLIYVLLFSDITLFVADSQGYIDFAASRPIGYPIFLWTIKTLTGSYALIPYLQLSFYMGASFYCALSFYRLSQSLLLTVGLLLGIFVNISFIRLSFSILTEAIGGGLLLLLLGIVFSFLRNPNLKKAYLIFGFTGLMCLIRPTFYCFLGVLPLFCFFQWSFFQKNISRTLVGPTSILLLILGLGSLGNYMNHRFEKESSFLGLNLIGKVALIANPEIPSSYPAIMKRFGKTSQEIQKMMDKAPSLRERYLLAAPCYDLVRFFIIPKLLTDPEVTPLKEGFSSTLLALEIIKANPLGYAQDVLMNYLALWQLWDFFSFKEGKEFKEILNSIPSEKPFNLIDHYYSENIRAGVNSKYGFPFVVIPLRIFSLGAFILSFIFPLVAFSLWIRKKPSSSLVLAGTFAGLSIQGGYLLTALLQVGIARYALLFWPCVIILLTVSLKLALDNLRFK